MDHSRAANVLTSVSFAAWAIGVAMLGFVFWQDAHHDPGAHGDVAAGLAGLALVFGVAVCVLATAMGAAFGTMAVRRAPQQRGPVIARGLNLVTMLGVMLSVIVNAVLFDWF